jgi:predicted GNAT family acetyltransferase
MASPDIRDNQEARRFEAHVDGRLAGFAEYMIANELIIFTHTEVRPEYEGKGIGSALVQAGLDSVRAEGSRQVMPLCPFVKMWIERHPDYRPLVFAPKPSAVKD